MRIATHNAKFHTDDVFAVAALSILYPDAEVIRTRDESLLKEADIVVDVGEIYDPSKNRFDHHQAAGAGKRANEIPYSSFGLVWNKFGETICGSVAVANKIDAILVQPIDASDNGVDTFTPVIDEVKPFTIQGVIDQYRFTWKESGDWDEKFAEAVSWAREFLKREIKAVQDIVEAQELVKNIYEASSDKKIVVIGEDYSFGRELVTDVLVSYPEPTYAVLFRRDHSSWQLVAVRKSRETFELRKPLPESWRAKHKKELEEITGVKGGVYCHRRGFMCITESKESAIKLAEIALNA